MARDSLIDFFQDVATRPDPFLVYDDGYRSHTWRYADLSREARAFAARLHRAGLAKGDKVVVWGENRPEWIVAFWGCLLRGIVVVPIDYRASAAFLERVRGIVAARVVLVGEEVAAPEAAAGVLVWRLADIGREAPLAEDPPAVPIGRDDVAEIIFTSGATAEPKGVVITHRNILANIVPIEREVAKYKRYAWLVSPLRFLNLLPLSHMFGQAMATFVPPMLTGTVVFIKGFNPVEIVRQIHGRRVSVLVCVPKILDLLREHLRGQLPDPAAPPSGTGHWMRRWWRYRAIHRRFGWKFWCVVVGAAPLEAELEEFWSRLGFLVVQGYGLTETAPIVTLNHPFAARRGSVGRPISGVEVKVGPDGEILVRGENVTQGYFNAPDATAEALEDGWLHTGDIGGLDEAGRLYIRGRKKEMIVTPEGLNVFPEDVERVLNALPGVIDSAVVGRTHRGEERVHAVVVLAPGRTDHAVMREANARLADHQRLRSVSAWPGDALPRTEGTRKLRRREIRQWVEAGEEPGTAARPPEVSLESVVARFAHAATPVRDDATLEALGLSSLERVELLMALEESFQVTIDEAEFAAAASIGDLRRLLERPSLPSGGREVDREPVSFPSWNLAGPVALVRRLSLATWILPLARAFVWLRVEGREHLEALRGPVVFAANHQSHLDTPAILLALPPRFRYRVAVAMAKEFFKAHFFPQQYGRRAWLTSTLSYYLAATFFSAFPLPQREAGARQTLRYVGTLLGEGHSVLIFPEGQRTDRGEIRPFRQGIGMMAGRLDVPVVPVRLEGLHERLHHTARMARPGRARVRFGPPLVLKGDDYAALTARVEQAVRAL